MSAGGTSHPIEPSAPAGLDHCPFWPTYGPPTIQFVRGAGLRAVGQRRPPLPRLPGRPGRGLARPLPSRGGRGARRPGVDPAPHLEPVRHRARRRGGRHPRPAARRRRPGVHLQLRRRGERGGHQAGPPLGRTGPPRRRERLRLVPRAHAGHAARHRPAREARGLPAAARRVPPRGLGRPRRPGGGASTPASPPCCSSRCRARAASTRPAPRTSQGVRRLCDERGAAVHGRRGADRSRAAPAGGSASSTTASCPTW